MRGKSVLRISAAVVEQSQPASQALGKWQKEVALLISLTGTVARSSAWRGGAQVLRQQQIMTHALKLRERPCFVHDKGGVRTAVSMRTVRQIDIDDCVGIIPESYLLQAPLVAPKDLQEQSA
eukprot:jgi/Chlat1/4780/Chrsp308S04745